MRKTKERQHTIAAGDLKKDKNADILHPKGKNIFSK